MSYEMNKNKMVPAICTQCGAQIEVDPSRDAAICPYCKTAFVVEKAVKNYVAQNIQTMNVEYIDTVNINTMPLVKANSPLHFLDRALDRRSRRKLEKEKLELEKERLKAEKAKREAEERERERKLEPLYMILGTLVIIIMFAFMYFNKSTP